MESSSSGIDLTLAPYASYQAKDLASERKFKGQEEEWLVKWVLQPPEGSKKLTEEERRELENANKEYCIWMRRNEIKACCPHLLSFKATPAATASETEDIEDGSSHSQVPLNVEMDESLREMKDDVRHLITRAKRLMALEGSSPGLTGGKVLSNAVSILSAYAKIGSLTDTFQEHGTVDLLLGLLTSRDEDVRRHSSDMLRSLTSFDLSIRGYVLLQLIQSDEGAKSSLQSRQMLLDLFSETASSDECDVKGITFPQVL